MHFAPFSALASLIAAVAAQTSTGPNPPTVSSGFMVIAGQPATLTWMPTTSGSVTLTLRSGAASNLHPGTIVASGIPNSGKYTFTLRADTTRNSDYTIEISSDSDSSEVNYTPQFVVESTNTVESIIPTASATATSASSAASSLGTAASTVGRTATKSSTSSASARSASSMSTTTSSATSSSTRGASSASPEAPSTGAGIRTELSVQAGFAAVLLGAVAVY